MPANSRTRGARGRVVARVLLGVVAVLTCLWSYATPAHAQSASCAGVWVVVDKGALGGITTSCAGTYSTGMTALRSVSTVVLDAGMVVKIDNVPSVANTQENYWSYWHATRQADGSYSGWSYSSVGPSSYHPTPGEAEGWRYAPVGGGYVAPGVAPPTQAAATQAPATTAPATTKATTAATRAATTAAGQTTTQAGTAASTAPESPTAPTSSTMVEAPASTPVTIGSGPDMSSAAPAQPASMSTGSLFGGVIAILAIAAGTIAMVLWRKRVAATG